MNESSSTTSSVGPPSAPASVIDEIFSFRERLLLPRLPVHMADDPVALARVLISNYSRSPWDRCELRERAAHFVARLAKRNDAVLELIIADAANYAEHLTIDDSFPFNPNGFDVLREIGPQNERVLSFLRHVAADSPSHSARCAAAEILSVYDCAEIPVTS